MKEPTPASEISVQNVLFATDFSPASEAGFAYAVKIAERYCSKLYVAHVINLEPFSLVAAESTPAIITQAREQARQKIDRLLGSRRSQVDRYQAIVAEGNVAEVLVDILQRNHIDIAVLGTHGRRAFKKLLLGSIAEEIFRAAPCPVLTVGPRVAPAPGGVELRHILYPLEFAPDPSEAAKYAVSLARQCAANLTIMNVSEDMPRSANSQEQITEPIESWIEDQIPGGSELCHRVRFERGFGPAAEAILDFATKATVDLIVMSVRRLDPVVAAHLPRPDTAYEVVSRAPCPVLTVR
jgi:nucleotide-binding universal stress UspA family protein